VRCRQTGHVTPDDFRANALAVPAGIVDQPLLESAYTELQARAATITDPAVRASFPNDIPEHREIVAAALRQTAALSRIL